MTLVTPSSFMFHELESSFLNRYPKVIIPNGIDLSAFKVKKEINQNKFQILGVASIWEKNKGLDDFIELSSRLDSNIFEIKIVGALPKGVHLPSHITYVPRFSDQSLMNKMYQEANIYIHLSKEDNLPTTIIEAIASGTPVVAYDIGGVKDLITPNVGFMVKKGGLNDVIDKIMFIKHQRLSYSPECVSSLVNRFNKQEMIDAYMKLYVEVTNY